MYKLFLCFRYLTRKGIVIFPILVVWLCVMMMIIVASIMGGFVDRVREANRGLMGDIVIESRVGSGWPYYEELQQELKDKVPEVELCTPVIHAYGLFNVPGGNNFAQVIGIRPEDRARISNFKQSLYLQDVAPRAALEDLSRGGFPATREQLLRRAVDQANNADAQVARLEEQANSTMGLNRLERNQVLDRNHRNGAELWQLAGGEAVVALILLTMALARRGRRKLYALAAVVWILSSVVVVILGFTSYRAFDRFVDRANDLTAQARRGYTASRLVEALPAGKVYKSREELAADLIPSVPSFAIPPALKAEAGKAVDGCIIGVDLGLIPRDTKGNYDHSFLHYQRAVVTVMPVSARGSALFSQPRNHSFIVVDDSYTKVYDVDSTYVYIPFEVAQDMALMSGLTDEEGKPLPARCSELQLKIKDADNAEKLLAVQEKIQQLIAADFAPRHPDVPRFVVQTWDQKQATYIKAVRNEKGMIIFILGLMSIVVVVVIFLIFWMIVRDKTRDIGIIKALGGSEEGVAGIFLLYGLFIGGVGGALGGVLGTLFVWHTNWIHDSFLYDIFGVTIWDRSVYLFDRIPDKVDPTEVAIYVVAAILAGAIGALIPAVLAGLRDPVKAVRFE